METLMTVDDVAKKMNFSASTIRKHIQNRTIPFIRIGAAIRFSPSEMEEWIKTNREAIHPKATINRR